MLTGIERVFVFTRNQRICIHFDVVFLSSIIYYINF